MKQYSDEEDDTVSTASHIPKTVRAVNHEK